MIISPDTLAPNTTYSILSYTALIHSAQIPFQEKLNTLRRTPLDEFLTREYFFMYKQFGVLINLIKHQNTINFDGVDLIISIAALSRTIIENTAAINYLVHDKSFNNSEKSDAITEFKNLGINWLKDHPEHLNKTNLNQLKEFLCDESIKKKLRGNLIKHIYPQDNKTLTRLIQNFKYSFPFDEKKLNSDDLYQSWDTLSKFLHNNTLYRSFFWSEADSEFNFNMFANEFNTYILTLGQMFLYGYLNDLVTHYNDPELSKIYQKLYEDVDTEYYNRICSKS